MLHLKAKSSKALPVARKAVLSLVDLDSLQDVGSVVLWDVPG